MKTVASKYLFCAGLLILLLAVSLAGLYAGPFRMPPGVFFRTLFTPDSGMESKILFEIRLPRVILGILTGAAFAVSGAVFQGVMRNPLASPGIIGVSAGGGLAGILVLLVFPQFGFLLLPAAFAGAFAAALAVYLLAWKRGVTPVRLILSGVAISAMLGAFSSILLLLHADKAGGVLNFSIGSLSARGWPHFYAAGGWLLAGFLLAFALSGRLNILMLGDDLAAGFGIKVERTRFLLLTAGSLLAAGGVSIAGMLGFAGLIAPHMVRILLGADNRFLLPGSALFGAVLVVACDTAGRVIGGGTELPAGVLMSLLGPPFFLWLLRRSGYEA